jgi:elongation factor 3
MPAATSQVAAENAKSVKVLDELMQKLTISKEADAIKEASGALASFINGRIEDLETPTR